MVPSIISCAPVALAFLSLVSAATIDRRASTCNGHSELCDRSFGNVTFVGAHDSYAVGTNNVATNQDYNITQQLNDGIRMLQMQAHNSSGTIELCHTSCLLFDGGSLETYLTTVKTWMDANTNDVVSLLIVNSDGFSASDFASVFQSVGLDTMSYSPTSSNLTYTSWPTLGTLIDAGTRLVTFMDTHADFSTVTYIIDEFTNVWETAYDVTDPTFDCDVNRTKGDSTNQMYLINHFLDTNLLGSPIPDTADLDTTNAANGTGSLGAQLDTCVGDYGRNPNFMLVDFYEYGGGSVFEVAATANGVTYDPTTPIATPLSSSSSSSTSSSSGSVGKLSANVLLGPAAAFSMSLMAAFALLG
ncbi:PLC-like phosphodiesterase [Stereum hirsutum FP-91666 SS1]|uniref:PLC-like phosphodiesterase n=1 Tax=Stereum hirsutum (strain FP-91666) TaxID=721885 RepID=UPI000440BA12|nr:PLC-like phosphodiesterase [Stereum hirsutum FP-91666 SS1]EIM92250.1 PLC-like phosphodiesterase [Stereum hirsutum FP-91666 SS1]